MVEGLIAGFAYELFSVGANQAIDEFIALQERILPLGLQGQQQAGSGQAHFDTFGKMMVA